MGAEMVNHRSFKSDIGVTMGSPGRTWCDHMEVKNWVDADEFDEAFDHAVELHGVRIAA